MSDKAWKAAERTVARKLGTRRTPLSGQNSGHTRSDTLHGQLFVEVKLRAVVPLWDELAALRAQARKVGKQPLIVVEPTRQNGQSRLAVTDLDTALARRSTPGVPAFLDAFLVEHRPLAKCQFWGLFAQTRDAAAAEGKRPLVVYKARARPGELAVTSLEWFL